MFASIITFLLPIASWIFKKYVESEGASADMRISYLKFLESMQKSSSTPAKMKMSYADQIKKLKESQPPENPQ